MTDNGAVGFAWHHVTRFRKFEDTLFKTVGCRWMFWTDWGTEPKIERAGMDGSHRQVIVSYEVKWPNGLTLDHVRKRVYWVDAKLNVISSCNYDGSQWRVILYSPDALHHPFSITTFEDWVYWTDWDKQAVYRANKFKWKDISPMTATHMVSAGLWYHGGVCMPQVYTVTVLLLGK